MCSTVLYHQDCSKCFTLYSLANLFIFEKHPGMAQRLLEHTYPPLSVARYSFIHLSELEQCGMKKLAQGLTQHQRIQIWVLLVECPKL